MKVLEHASLEAHNHNGSSIWAHHILLGLSHDEEIRRELGELPFSVSLLFKETWFAVDEKSTPLKKLDFTPKAIRTLRLGIDEAISSGSNQLLPLDLLIGIIITAQENCVSTTVSAQENTIDSFGLLSLVSEEQLENLRRKRRDIEEDRKIADSVADFFKPVN